MSNIFVAAGNWIAFAGFFACFAGYFIFPKLIKNTLSAKDGENNENI